jgi:hypothetical protein
VRPFARLAGLLLVCALLPATEARSGSVPPPVIWFAPLAPNPACGCNYGGSLDYMRLFAANAPWKKAARRVRVFKLYGGWVEFKATTVQLRRIGRDLRRRGIAVGVEAAPLVATTACGENIEGYDGADGAVRLATKLEAAGVTPAYIAFDEPFYDGSLVDGPTACHWTPAAVASEIGVYLGTFRSFFPHVAAGDIEPLTAGLAPLESWLATYRRVVGRRLAFFHLDVQFENGVWPAQATELERFARARDVPFGFIDIGEGDTDLDFARSAEQRDAAYELEAGGRPDQLVFQSWLDRPDHVLPERRPGSFTWLIDRYFRPRPALTLAVSTSAPTAARTVSGSLVTAGGRPVAGAKIAVTARMLTGPGTDSTIEISGTVPPGATQAQVGLRVNTECGCSGASDVILSGASYHEGPGGNLVPNPDFAQGLTGWDVAGTAVQLESAPSGSGSRVHVLARAGEQVSVNSSQFPVTAGARFVAAFATRVAPISRGSGYYTVIFEREGVEFDRRIAAFEPASWTISTRTGPSGRFTGTVPDLPPGRRHVEARFGGSALLFPAYASRTSG